MVVPSSGKKLGEDIQSRRWQCPLHRTVTPTPSIPHWCEALYDLQVAKLILYGRALGLSHGESEDVVQEVFAALLGLGEAPERPEHYLVRAFRNRVFNFRRSLWRRLAREWESRSWFEPSPVESPAEQAAMRCLYELPTEQREVIVLKIWHEHTFEEIGTLLDLSPNTVAGRYRYGLARLRICLRNPAPEESHESRRSSDRTAGLLDTAIPFPRA